MVRRPLDFSKREDRKRWVFHTPLRLVAISLMFIGVGLSALGLLGLIPMWLDVAVVISLILAATGVRMLGERWETWKLAGQDIDSLHYRSRKSGTGSP